MIVSDFEKKVYNALKKVPRGKVTAYGDLALAIGSLRSARAVGNALNKNPFAPKVPCHRVVKGDGAIGGFASGSKKKIDLLKKEGVAVEKGKICNFDKIRFRAF